MSNGGEHPLRVLTVCTGWDSSTGGVATVNRELSIALAELGHDVTARVAAGTGEDPHGLVAMRAVIPPEGVTDRDALALQPQDLPERVDVIIGHSRFSGPAAQRLRDERYPDATLVHVVHTNVEELDRLREKPGEAHLHFVTERNLIDRADVIVGVGPVLHAEAARMAQMSLHPKVVHEYIPGTPAGASATNVNAKAITYLYLVGRTDDPFKGAKTAAKAVKILNKRGYDVRLAVRGTKAVDDEQAKDEKRLAKHAGGSAVRTLPYSTDPAELAADLRGADIMVMPSVCEGGGLVASEAAGHGVPIMVSADSGSGRFLNDPRRVPPELARHTTVAPTTGKITPQGLADALEPLVRDREHHRALALARREHLVGNYSPQHAAAGLVDAIHHARSTLPRPGVAAYSQRATQATQAPQARQASPLPRRLPSNQLPRRGQPPRRPPGTRRAGPGFGR
jgi:glycosyltransferase involved in cell wall biosynthesis